jgi:preprotein translocase subunit SecA
MFEEMLTRLRENVTGVLSHVELRLEMPEAAFDRQPPAEAREFHGIGDMLREDEMADQLAPTGTNGVLPPPPRGTATIIGRRPPPRGRKAGPPPPGWIKYEATGNWLDPKDPSTWGKVPRNKPCPCDSGKKYKHCHGAV